MLTCPILGQTELLAEVAFDAEQTLDLGIVGLQHVVDVLLGDAELFGVQHREVDPLHDVEPLVVTVANRRAERLLRDDLRQHGVVVGLAKRSREA